MRAHRVWPAAAALVLGLGYGNGIRVDVPADELASYCLHAITAASSLPTKTAVRRLVAVILRGLHPRG